MSEFWLARVTSSPSDFHLTDGPHHDRAGVEKAAYLFQRLGLGGDNKYVGVEVFEVKAAAHGANEEAIQTIISAKLRPTS